MAITDRRAAHGCDPIMAAMKKAMPTRIRENATLSAVWHLLQIIKTIDEIAFQNNMSRAP